MKIRVDSKKKSIEFLQEIQIVLLEEIKSLSLFFSDDYFLANFFSMGDELELRQSIAFLWLAERKSVFLTGGVSPTRRHKLLETMLVAQSGTNLKPRIQVLSGVTRVQPFDLSLLATSLRESPVQVASLAEYFDLGAVVPDALTPFLHLVQQQDMTLSNNTKVTTFSSEFHSFRRNYTYTQSLLDRLRSTTHLLLLDLASWPCHLLHHLDVVCRVAYAKNTPFGGIPVLLEGDWNRIGPMNTKYGNALATALIESLVEQRVFQLAPRSSMDLFWKKIWDWYETMPSLSDRPETLSLIRDHFAETFQVSSSASLASMSSSASPYLHRLEYKSSSSSSSSKPGRKRYGGISLHVVNSNQAALEINLNGCLRLDHEYPEAKNGTARLGWTYRLKPATAGQSPEWIFLSPSGLGVPTLTSNQKDEHHPKMLEALQDHFKPSLMKWTLPLASGTKGCAWRANMPVRYVPSQAAAPLWPLRYGMWGVLSHVQFVQSTPTHAVVLFSNGNELSIPLETRKLYHPLFEQLSVSYFPLVPAFACTSYELGQSVPYRSGPMVIHYSEQMLQTHGRLYTLLSSADDVAQIQWSVKKFPMHIERDELLMDRAKTTFPPISNLNIKAWSMQWDVRFASPSDSSSQDPDMDPHPEEIVSSTSIRSPPSSSTISSTSTSSSMSMLKQSLMNQMICSMKANR